MEIVPGVHMIEGSVGCNTYLIIDDGVTLVDTGLKGNVPHIYHYLEKIGRKPEDIRRIVITHAHLDHINCLYKLKKDTGAIVMASEEDADIVEGKKARHTPSGGFGALFSVLKIYYSYTPVKVDVRLQNGESIDRTFDFKVIALPGHSHGNIGLYSALKKTLMSSDSVRVLHGKVALPSARFTDDMTDAMTSLDRMSDLSFDVLLPGHGMPVTADPAGQVRALVKEHSP